MNISTRNFLNTCKSIVKVKTPDRFKRYVKMFTRGNKEWEEYKDQSNFEHLVKKYSVSDLYESKVDNRICIFTKDGSKYESYFKNAAEDLGIELGFIDPLSVNWYSEIQNGSYDGYIFAIEYNQKVIREAFREKMNLMYRQFPNKIWPSPTESYIYESKRRLSYFLKSEGIPYPSTHVFFKEKEAQAFIQQVEYPIISKTDMGASSSGVSLLHNEDEAKSALKMMFRKGFVSDSGDYREKDFGYIIFQEFLPDVREFRIIKIGDYWFGHEKKQDDDIFHSGSGVNEWTPPTAELLNFCKDIAENNNINVAAFDVFKNREGEFLVNEIQTWFGSYNPSQMYINNTPGAYTHIDGEWIFKEGLYNINSGANLRLLEFNKYLNEGFNYD